MFRGSYFYQLLVLKSKACWQQRKETYLCELSKLLALCWMPQTGEHTNARLHK